MSCKGHFKQLHDVIAELFENMDTEDAPIFYEKMKELLDEQATNLQKDIRTS